MQVIFGDKDTGLIGMKEKVDEIHTILLQVKNVSKFFGGIGDALKWLLIITAVIGAVKGWWVGLLTSIAHKL